MSKINYSLPFIHQILSKKFYWKLFLLRTNVPMKRTNRCEIREYKGHFCKFSIQLFFSVLGWTIVTGPRYFVLHPKSLTNYSLGQICGCSTLRWSYVLLCLTRWHAPILELFQTGIVEDWKSPHCSFGIYEILLSR